MTPNLINGGSVDRYVPEELPPAVERLIANIPELERSYNEHLMERHGELIPYTYLPDVVRLLVEKHEAGTLEIGVLKRLSDAIEDILRDATPSVRDLIVLGVLEEVINSQLWPLMQNYFGPVARKHLSRMKGSR